MVEKLSPFAQPVYYEGKLIGYEEPGTYATILKEYVEQPPFAPIRQPGLRIVQAPPKEEPKPSPPPEEPKVYPEAEISKLLVTEEAKTVSEAKTIIEAKEEVPKAMEYIGTEFVGEPSPIFPRGKEEVIVTYAKPPPKVIEMEIGGMAERLLVTEKEAVPARPISLISTLPTEGKVTEPILISDIKGKEVPILKPMLKWGEPIKTSIPKVVAVEVGREPGLEYKVETKLQKETREAWEKHPARGPVSIVMHLPEIITTVGPHVIAAGVGTEARYWANGCYYFRKVIQWGMFLAAPVIVKGVPSKLKIPTGFPLWTVKKTVGAGLMGAGLVFGVAPHWGKATKGDVEAQLEVTKGITTMAYGALMVKPTARTVLARGEWWRQKGMGLMELYPKRTAAYWKGKIYYGVGETMAAIAGPFVPEPKVTWEVPSLKGYEKIETVTTRPRKPGYGEWKEIRVSYDPFDPNIRTAEIWSPTTHRKVTMYPEYYSYREVETLADVKWKTFTTVGFRATRLGRPGISLESIPTVEDVSKAMVSDKQFEHLIKIYPEKMIRVTPLGEAFLGAERYPSVLTEEGWSFAGVGFEKTQKMFEQAVPGTSYMKWGTYRFVKGPRPWQPYIIEPPKEEVLEAWKISKRLIETGKPEGALESKIFKFELGLEDIPVMREGTITIPLERTSVEVKSMAKQIIRGREPGFVRTDIISGTIGGLGIDIEPEIKPFTETVLKPLARPSVEPTIRIEPSIRPIVRPIVSPAIKPIIKPIVEPMVQPSMQPIMRPIIRPAIRPRVKPKVMPQILPMPMPQPTPKPIPLPFYLPSDKGLGIRKRKRKKVKRKYAYRPSVVGLAIAKPIMKPLKKLTGYEIRPPLKGGATKGGYIMAKRRKRKRKKKKKR